MLKQNNDALFAAVLLRLRALGFSPSLEDTADVHRRLLLGLESPGILGRAIVEAIKAEMAAA
ncbi:MAG: hypothetical protein ACRYFS_21920 [Janthinobacterium lividum]